jgi:maltose-binding protein MalE
LGYETLGVFYNKSLIREIPKTWNDLEGLYRDSTTGKYPSNLGLGPTYVPNMVDILPLWLTDAGARDYSDISTGKNGLSNYLDYANLGIGTTQNTGEADIYTTKNTLSQQKSDMMDEKNTTLDLFMQ